MDALTFFVGMTKALAWPALVAWVVWLLQAPLLEVVSRLGRRKVSVKAGGAEVNLSEEITKVEEEVQATAPEKKGPTMAFDQAPKIPASSLSAPLLTEVVRQANESDAPPAFIVNEVWSKAMAALGKAVREHAPNAPPSHVTPFMLLSTALRTGVISNAEHAQLVELRKIRNIAVHQVDADITRTDALRFTAVVDNLLTRLTNEN